jgi:hypothetical protein
MRKRRVVVERAGENEEEMGVWQRETKRMKKRRVCGRESPSLSHKY